MKLKIILSAILILGLAGCNALENDSTSGSTLLLISLTGFDLEGGGGSAIAYSDVIKADGSIVNDVGEVTVSAMLLDPVAEGSTYYQDVIVDQVDVEYFRTDGRNTQGVDVPYSFSEPVNVYVQIEKSVSFGFTLVRHTAKLEAPLVELIELGQEKILELVAKVTLYGKDVGGHRVKPVSGYITIYCSNFADTAEEPTP